MVHVMDDDDYVDPETEAFARAALARLDWSEAEQKEARGHWPGDGCGPATIDHFAPPWGKGRD